MGLIKRIKKWFYTKDGEEQKEINKQLIVIVVSVIVTVISVMGVTFSAFVWSDNSTKNQTLEVGNISLDISSNSSPLGSSLKYPVPATQESSLVPYTFTIRNNGSLDEIYNVYIEEETKTSTGGTYTNDLDEYYIYMSLSGAATIDRTPLSKYSDRPIDSGILKPGESKTYNLRLWIIGQVPNVVIGQEWHGKITVDTEQRKAEDEMGRGLADAIKEDNTINTNKPDFHSNYDNASTEEGSGGRGLFVQQGDSTKSVNGQPTYYFRGDVQNNYVSFAGFTWRIVRINEDGSVRLMLSEPLSTTSVYSSTNSTYSTSTIKTTLETWYTNNISKYSSNIQNTTFCNDLTYGYQDRRTSPTFTCPSSSGTLNLNIGLITADEMMYAGYYTKYDADTGEYPDKSYMYDDVRQGKTIWTMTPVDSEFMVSDPYYITDQGCRSTAYVVPVINLKGSTLVSGIGSISYPYTVK